MIYDLRYCIDNTGTIEFNWRIVPEYENEIDEICINIANGDETETIILDMIKMLDSCLGYEVVREKEFASIKNKTGVDSVESARELLKLNGIEL